MFRTIPALFAVFILATGCAATPPAWRTSLSIEHPLVGKIWRPGTAAFAEPEALTEALAKADFVFLGEKHDNPDHHRLQAWLLERIVAAGRRPAVVWEMIDEDKQPALDAHLAAEPGDAAGLGAAIGWKKSGWPDWRGYQPIAEVALANDLPMIAGSLPRAIVREIGRGGLATMPDDRRARLGLDRPPPREVAEAMRDIVYEAHCKLMPRKALAPMVMVQHVRDAVLADNLLRAQASAGSAVLITGGGHARRDLAAPRALAAMAPDATQLTLAFLEVDDEVTDPAAYAEQFSADTLPFDYVWFTPRANDRDYCAELREQFKGHKKKSKQKV